MTCDAVIVSFNSAEPLPNCLRSVLPQVGDRRVFVVDNASNDASRDVVGDRFPDVELIANENNLGYGAAINRALEQSTAEFVLCLNPDVRLESSAIGALLACAGRHEDCIAVAPRLTYPDGSFHSVCRRYPTLWRNFCHMSGIAARLSPESTARYWLSEAQHDGECDVDMVSGACVLFRRSYLNRVGGFDERIFLYEEESDVFLPARELGVRAFYCPDAIAVHAHGGSSSTTSEPEDTAYHRFRSKYFVFGKHYGAAAARCAYWTDRIVFAASWLRHLASAQRSVVLAAFRQAHRAYFDARQLLESK